MIGVIHRPEERPAVEEFFQLFKTAWEPYAPGRAYDAIIASTDAPAQAKLVLREPELFRNVKRLLKDGQSAKDAQTPALDLGIKKVRDAIVAAGIPFVEIPPAPAGYPFTVCLTHDIDFVGIRRHRFDHTMWGFLYRSTVGAVRDLARGRADVSKAWRMGKAAATLPLVHLGLARDFWIPFEWYLNVERGLPATYYFIPFKGRVGEKVNASHAARRASAYDITDIPEWVSVLKEKGCEVAVHGIDAWHSVDKGREELRRVGASAGVRMHWLMRDEQTPRVLEEAGYDYDSTVGYNETVGFRAGTSQVYLPPGSRRLLELPMHIQDGALFYPQQLGLSEPAGWELCMRIVQSVREHGGVLTLLWHDRSHGPERFWGEFYARLVEHLKSMGVWFASARQVVGWFRARREVVFQGMELTHCGEKIDPPLNVRLNAGGKSRDVAWSGSGKLSPA